MPALCTSSSSQVLLLKIGFLLINSMKLLKGYVKALQKLGIHIPEQLNNQIRSLYAGGNLVYPDFHPDSVESLWQKIDPIIKQNLKKLMLSMDEVELSYGNRPTKITDKDPGAFEINDNIGAFQIRYNNLKKINEEYVYRIKIIDKSLEKQLLSHAQKALSMGYNASEYLHEYRDAIVGYSWAKQFFQVIDFDDMIDYGNKALSIPEIHKTVTSEFLYTLVDEFQDLNRAQMEVILKLQSGRGWITAVGDERQSIYRFRGATPINNFQSFISNFLDDSSASIAIEDPDKSESVDSSAQKDLVSALLPAKKNFGAKTESEIANKDCLVVIDLTRDSDSDSPSTPLSNYKKSESIEAKPKEDTKPLAVKEPVSFEKPLYNFESLNTNYRSNVGIVTFANTVIKESKYSTNLIKSLRVNLLPSKEIGYQKSNPIRLWNFKDHFDEAEHIANCISTLINQENHRPCDIAILLRKFRQGPNNLTHHLQIKLLQKGIKFVVRGGRVVIDKQDFSILFALICAVTDPRDDASFKKAIQKLVPGVGPSTLSKIDSISLNSKGTSKFSDEGSLFFEQKVILSNNRIKLSKAIQKKLMSFIQIIYDCRKVINQVSLRNFILAAYEVMDILFKNKDFLSNFDGSKGPLVFYDKARNDLLVNKTSVSNVEFYKHFDTVRSETGQRNIESSLKTLVSLLDNYSDTILDSKAPKIFGDSFLNISLDLSTDNLHFNEFVSNERGEESNDDSCQPLKQTLVNSDSIATVDLVQSFIGYLTLDSDTSLNPNDHDKIIISTIHQAKGLEWDTVFLPLFCQGIIPSNYIQDSVRLSDSGLKNVYEVSKGLSPTQEHKEDELRLAYVSITRAKRNLFISFPSKFDNANQLEINGKISFNEVETLELSSFIPSSVRKGGTIGATTEIEYNRF
ncbi:hypothetical protein BB560_005657 [Smittium megazygosporum]|uniref:DNA 3'-5' helicase n=1 Tax=Smittium megazygosporum TaxID=133381 RepID=A0A2T9Z1N0_9FUNG|nr:hypothetical protein BB560_005657 [Smittium megazygosporum]